MKCQKCQFENPEGFEFCGKCGQRLEQFPKVEEAVPTTESERKYVTVLFSDLSGYTALSEKLDPEEVKEITSGLFSQISEVIAKYEGLVEKFIGDAVVALFGVPKGYEDDPVRAIRAAREIHELVDAESPKIEKRVGQPLAMHTGINTGLVVTGEVDVERGTHGVAGDTVNLASRLQGLANAGEILVGWDTYRQSEGYFNFEELEPTKVKGKDEPVRIYKVLSPKEEPSKIHRLRGLRAELIGRKVELAKLQEAVNNLRTAKGTIFSISGDAGTGKSRLVEEFKATLDPREIQWQEGHAYAYSQNIPYFPLIDFLNRVFQIEEGDPPGKLREKVESGIRNLVREREDIIPYVGSLYALSYPEIESISPEFWKSRMAEGIQMVLSALARERPTIFCLEDLHWADPSFVELLRNILVRVSEPAIVLCVYRPEFNLFKSSQLNEIGKIYREIRLTDLSPSDSQHMLESLLKTETIPSDLRRLVQDKAEGNPFYLEELVNSLIESDTLIRDNGSWKVTRSLTESEISSTIHGVIIGRLDRLEKKRKRVLQEASVIGRTFLYEILRKITDLQKDIDESLKDLEQLDLIRTRSFLPDLEYIFKHALTQEVVYNGLLIKERSDIHERIGLIMEELFKDRLPEFYETLAFHFKQGKSIHKAVDYLMKSGEKSLNRFALEEAHQYYQQAYELLSLKEDRAEADNNLLFDLLEKWALVHYYYGTFRDLITLFRTHETLAESLKDKGRRGMFYAWLGMALWAVGKSEDSYRYLRKGLKLGEEAADSRVIGYAYTWLPNSCAELGRLHEGVGYGQRAKEIANRLSHEQYLYFKSRGDLGLVYYFRGESGKVLKAGKEMIEYGEKHTNIRSQAMGHAIMGWGHLAAGDLQAAINALQRVEEIALDPFYATVWSVFRGLAHLFVGQVQEAEDALLRSEKCWKAGFDYLEGFLPMGWGLFWINKRKLGKGMSMLLKAREICLKNEWKWSYGMSEYILGRVYLVMVLGEEEVSLSTMLKNLGFLLKTIPFAARRAESHFRKAIEVSREIGAKGTQASAHLDLGYLHKAKGRNERARNHLTEAVKLFEQCEAKIFLVQAKEALASLG